MKTILLVPLIFLLILASEAQTSKNIFSADIEFAVPANKPLLSNKANGFTNNLRGEHVFSTYFQVH